jgi:N-acetylmuramoyl-L-alanine amidase/putative methionine-R-sulfoxide reductase with GAF domain
MSANPKNINPGLSNQTQAARAGRVSPAGAPPQAHGDQALQALLAFSALHDQIRQRKKTLGGHPSKEDPWQLEQFVLDDVLHLVAERALAITSCDGVAIALAEGNAIVCRASVGEIAPDAKMRLDPNAGFSGACFRTGKIVRCDDAQSDPRVDVHACRRLGARSLVAVPLAGQNTTIGLLEAFSKQAYGFSDSNIRSLNLLAELILAAMKPEEENELAEISQRVTEESVSDLVRSPASQREDRNSAPQSHVEAAPAPITIEEPVAQGPPLLAVVREHLRARPGLMIAVGVVLLACVVGGGLWWKLHPASTTSVASRSGTDAASPTKADPPSTEADPQAPASPDTPAMGKANGLTLVSGVRHWASQNSTTVVVDLQGPVEAPEVHRLSDPERTYFDLPNTALASGRWGMTDEVGDPLLSRVRLAQTSHGMTRVVLDTKGGPHVSVSLEQNPYRLVLVVHSAESGPPTAKLDLFAPVEQAPLPQVSGQASKSPGPSDRKQVAAARQPHLRIVLDAGHGGWDEGTVGRSGLMEKDLALDLVARLGKLLSKRLGAEVIYTRRNDTYVPLEKRAEIANLSNADLFVSIHANYSELPTARGVETYYANTYSSVNARMPGSDAAALQNIDWTNVDIREKARQSQRLAVSVQNALYNRLAPQSSEIRNRGVRKASYVVLTGTMMPGILAEVSFVSSPADEKILKDPSYRERIAEGLYKGIARYSEESGKVTVASTSGKPTGR